MSSARDTALLVGLGNEYARDDAVGLVIVREARSLLPGNVRVLEHEGEPTTLLDSWGGLDRVVVVDAVRSGTVPGTIHRLRPLERPVPAALARGSTHALSVVEALELARAVDRLPRRLALLGVEGERFDAGRGLSDAVRRAADTLVAEIPALFRDAHDGDA